MKRAFIYFVVVIVYIVIKMALKFVRFSETHFQRVADVFVSATDRLRKSRGGIYPDKLMDEWHKWANTPGSMEKEFRDVGLRLLLAKLEGKIAGMFGYHDGRIITRDDIGDRTGFARLRYMFVDPDFQGMDVGRQLYLEVVGEVRKIYSHAYLYVIPSAHGFYERMGTVHVPEFDSLINPQSHPFDPELRARQDKFCGHVAGLHSGRVFLDFFFEARNL